MTTPIYEGPLTYRPTPTTAAMYSHGFDHAPICVDVSVTADGHTSHHWYLVDTDDQQEALTVALVDICDTYKGDWQIHASLAHIG